MRVMCGTVQKHGSTVNTNVIVTRKVIRSVEWDRSSRAWLCERRNDQRNAQWRGCGGEVRRAGAVGQQGEFFLGFFFYHLRPDCRRIGYIQEV